MGEGPFTAEPTPASEGAGSERGKDGPGVRAEGDKRVPGVGRDSGTPGDPWAGVPRSEMSYQDKLDRAAWLKDNYKPTATEYKGPCLHNGKGKDAPRLTTGDFHFCPLCGASRGKGGKWRVL